MIIEVQRKREFTDNSDSAEAASPSSDDSTLVTFETRVQNVIDSIAD